MDLLDTSISQLPIHAHSLKVILLLVGMSMIYSLSDGRPWANATCYPFVSLEPFSLSGEIKTKEESWGGGRDWFEVGGGDFIS